MKPVEEICHALRFGERSKSSATAVHCHYQQVKLPLSIPKCAYFSSWNSCSTCRIHEALSMLLPMPAHIDPTGSCADIGGRRWGGNTSAMYSRGASATHVVLMGINLVGFTPEPNHLTFSRSPFVRFLLQHTGLSLAFMNRCSQMLIQCQLGQMGIVL